MNNKTSIYFKILISLFIFCPGSLIAQNTLYVHSIYGPELTLVNLDDNCHTIPVGVMSEVMYDIAISPDGRLFGVSNSSRLHKLNKENGNGISSTPLHASLNALVYGPDNFLYGATTYGDIYKIDPNSGNDQLLGNCGFSSGGDLTFYLGKLYLSSESGQLIHVNLTDLRKSENIGPMKLTSVLGIITIGQINCDGAMPKMYAIADSDIYEVNPDNATNKHTCKVDVYKVGGAASVAESSTIIKSKAGKDSTAKICYGESTPVDLIKFLPTADKEGTWKDLDDSNGLNVGVLQTKQMKLGTYRFQYITGRGLCADTSTVSIQVSKMKMEVRLVDPSNCSSPNGIIEITLQSKYSGPLYSINNQPFQSEAKFQGLKPGEYFVKAKTMGNCETDTIIHLTALTAPKIIKITVKNSVCGKENGEIEIFASGGSGELSYSIDGIGFQASPRFVMLTAKQYNIQTMDAVGCYSLEKVNVDSTARLVIVDILTQNTSCGQSNGSIKVVATSGAPIVGYEIEPNKFQANNEFINLAPGLFEVTVSDQNGCMANQKTRIDSSSAPRILSVQVTPVDCGDSDGKMEIIAVAESEISYSISPEILQTSPIFENLEPGSYKIVLKDSHGCITERNAEISDKCKDQIFLPTAFSPNGDKRNDQWLIFFPQKKLYLNKLIILNRWGEIIHLTENIELRSGDSIWDGLVGKHYVTGNLFTYRMDIRFGDGKSRILKGSLTVFK